MPTKISHPASWPAAGPASWSAQGQMLVPESSVSYLLKDDFTTDESAPIASPRTAEPGPGSLVAVQTDGELSISGQQLSVPGQSTPAWGDLGIREEDGIARAAGRIWYAKFKRTSAGFGPVFLFNSVATVEFSGANTKHGIYFEDSTTIRAAGGNSVDIATYSINTEYEVAVVLRAAGAFLFIRGGNFLVWTLIYIYPPSDTTATLYAGMTNFSATSLIPTLRITASSTFSPTPTVSDSFDRGNSSSLGSTDGSGAEESGGDGFAWTEQAGDLEIDTNQLSHTGSSPGGSGWVATIDSALSNCLIQMKMIHGTGSSNGGIILRFSDTDNFWLVSTSDSVDTFNIFDRVAGSYTNRATTAKTIDPATEYDLLVIAIDDEIQAYCDGGSRLVYSSASFNQTETVHGVRFDGGGSSEDAADDFVVWGRTHSDFPEV